MDFLLCEINTTQPPVRRGAVKAYLFIVHADISLLKQYLMANPYDAAYVQGARFRGLGRVNQSLNGDTL